MTIWVNIVRNREIFEYFLDLKDGVFVHAFITEALAPKKDTHETTMDNSNVGGGLGAGSHQMTTN